MTYFHEEQRFSWWIWAIVLAIVVPTVVTAAVLGVRDPAQVISLMVGPLVIVLVITILGFAKLVTHVDDRSISVAFRLLWPARRIPLDDVKRAHAMTYNPLSYGGWAVHYMLFRGWSFDAGGGHGVLVETKSGPRILIGSHRAGELEAAIALAVAERSAR